MSQYPTQTRAIDAFASYNSDVVNRLSRMVTNGEDLLFSPKGMDVIADSTSPNDHIIVTPGSCFKDDVWIQITEEHQVDFNNALHYFGGSIIKEPGYYYCVLEYEFVKSRPSPQASIKIIPPSLLPSAYGSNHVFLKAVSATTGPWAIGNLYDYDPDNISIYRQNTSTWASVEHTLPTFSQDRDQGRIIHVRDIDRYYFGNLNTWERLDEMNTRINMSTSSDLNSLVYFDGTSWIDAIASSETTFAQAIVTEIGLTPKGRWAGELSVNVQSGVTINAGDFVYLSNSEAGTATNVRTNQQVGVALTSGTGTVTILFFPSASVSGHVKSQLNTWTTSGSDYYQDVDISVLSPALISDAFAVQCYDHSTGEMIDPMSIERIALNTFRIWMPLNTVSLDVIITG